MKHSYYMVLCATLLSIAGCKQQAVPEVARAAYGSPTREMASLRFFRDNGGQGSWSPSGGRIAYAMKNAAGHYRIHLADADGGNDINLIEHTPGLPGKHVGIPSWHASERYLLVTVEKPEHAGSSFEALPGFGGYTDIWLITVDGRQAWPLTNVPNDTDHGVLIPHFSQDGKQVVWSERIARPDVFSSHPAGLLAIKVADFVESPMPHLANIRSFEPGGKSFYETYGFSPDGKRVIFCSNMNGRPFLEQQIYTMDARTGGDVRQLTDKGYNEHAFYTPDGAHIIWMSNVDSLPGTDWWVMDANGGNKRRLSYFNQEGSPEYMGTAWAGTVTFSPDGRRMLGDIQLSLITQETTMRMVELRLASAALRVD